MFAPSTNTMSTIKKLEALRAAFDGTTEVGLECSCAIAAGEQNAAETIGWNKQGSEEFARLAIRSIECCLDDKSDAVKSAFKTFGITA